MFRNTTLHCLVQPSFIRARKLGLPLPSSKILNPFQFSVGVFPVKTEESNPVDPDGRHATNLKDIIKLVHKRVGVELVEVPVS